MDPLRYKRPTTQIRGQITNTNLRNSQPVPKALPTHPSTARRAPVGRRLPGLQTPAPATIPAPVAAPAVDVQHVTPSVVQTKPITPAPKQVARLASVAVAEHQASVPKKEESKPTPAPTPTRSPLDMSLPGQESPSRFTDMFSAKKWASGKQWAIRGTAMAMVLVVALGGLFFSNSYFKLHKVFKGGTQTAEALKTNVNPELLKGEGSGRVNVLLLGRGGGTHDAPDLTDTIMLASIDPVNHTSTLVSLPRDLWVNVPDHGVMKLNAVWQTGVFKYLGKNTYGSKDPKAIAAGYALVDQTVKNVLGVNVDYNVIVNFDAFKQGVDTVGGVTIDVPTDLVDPTMAWENDNNPVLTKAGIQTMDGKHALIYSRSRETSSDFARAQRQRQVLVALKTKIADAGTLSNPAKISGLMSAFGNNVNTDLSLKNATRMARILKDIPDTKFNSIGLTDGTNQLVTTGNQAGQSVVLPKAGLYKYEEIQQFIRTTLKDPYMLRENAKILILNGTLTPGQATKKADNLTKFGYNVIGTGNTPSGGWVHTTLVDLSNGKKKYTHHFLEQRLGITALSSLGDKTIATNGADFVIIIGNDEAITN